MFKKRGNQQNKGSSKDRQVKETISKAINLNSQLNDLTTQSITDDSEVNQEAQQKAHQSHERADSISKIQISNIFAQSKQKFDQDEQEHQALSEQQQKSIQQSSKDFDLAQQIPSQKKWKNIGSASNAINGNIESQSHVGEMKSTLKTKNEIDFEGRVNQDLEEEGKSNITNLQEQNQSSIIDQETNQVFQQIEKRRLLYEQSQATQIPNNPSTQKNPSKMSSMIILEQEDGYTEGQFQEPTQYKVNSSNSHHEPSSVLKVDTDYEGTAFSPQVSEDQNSQLFEQDFEDELIRKTLTRNNYNRVQQTHDLKGTKMSKHKEKLFQSITQISWREVEHKISSDMMEKVKKKSDLEREYKYLEDRLKVRESEVQKKKKALSSLEEQFQRVRQLIHFICYRGEQVENPEETLEISKTSWERLYDLSSQIRLPSDQQEVLSKGKRNSEHHLHKNGTKKVKLDGSVPFEIQEDVEGEQDDDDDGQFVMQEDQF